MKIPFDAQANKLLTNAIEAAEQQLERRGVRPELCDECLTLQYIETCADFMAHGIVYLPSEGKSASWIFLQKLAPALKKPNDCAAQLSNWTHLYFPRFVELLTVRYLGLLHTSTELQGIFRNGLVLLAAAKLPEARTEIRRELRRRGLAYDRQLVLDGDLRLVGARPPLIEHAGEIV